MIMILGPKVTGQGHGALVIENGFQTITDCNPPMMLKLYTPAPCESRMCLIDFGVKGLGLLGIEISQECSMFIQRVFETLFFCIFDAPFTCITIQFIRKFLYFDTTYQGLPWLLAYMRQFSHFRIIHGRFQIPMRYNQSLTEN